MRTEIRVSGVGGQGSITMGKIFGKAALYDKKQVIMTEAYGPEVTGGFARADLIISDEIIDYFMVNNPDILVVMAEEGWMRDGRHVTSDGKVLYEPDLVQITDCTADTISIPAFRAALDLGNKVVMNVVLMGALQEITQAVTKENLEKALLSSVPPRFKDLNVSALNKGYELGKNALKSMEVSA
ncbi:MAG: 2-oxoacid:acceptor oxidoreductase family protein [Candidatus Kariarchaeaceae archaeon]|jgi:2-oxoglutarate ferredoxin oxidoreductase subunit gamma